MNDNIKLDCRVLKFSSELSSRRLEKAQMIVGSKILKKYYVSAFTYWVSSAMK